MLDVLPKLIIELREDADVDAIVDGRVRGFEPAPPIVKGGNTVDPGDVQPAGSYRAFVLLSMLDANPYLSVPVQRPTIGVQCYGRNPIEASALWSAVFAAMHHIGPRIYANGLGIYISHVRGGAAEKDPDTQQPFYQGFIDAIATTVPVELGS